MTHSNKIWIPVAAGASAAALIYYFRRRASHSARNGRLAHLNAPPSRLVRQPDDCAVWRFSNRLQLLPPGKTLRLELASPAIVRWTTNGWDTVHDTRTASDGGLHLADLDTARLMPGDRVQFTFYWPEVNRWEGQDFDVRVAELAYHGGAMSD